MNTAAGAGAPWLSLGFRPFFLAAAAYAVVAMGAWFTGYALGLPVALDNLSPSVWHAHEMVYGYALAVIAGFLLTAVTNWTGLQTLRGVPLLLLLTVWLLARVAFHVPGGGLYWAALFDMVFVTVLLVAVSTPIFRKRQWRQLGILGKLLLLGAGNLLFYLGALGLLEQGMHWGLYTGFYLVIGLILAMSRRLIPFFIERGLEQPVQLRNSARLDQAALLLYLVFFIVEVFVASRPLAAALAAALFVLHLYRLSGWYVHGVWHRPLLWSLLLAYLSIIAGFALFTASLWFADLWFPALHAFAVGGIGLTTLSMMARVSLGHTGRNVQRPPRLVTALLWLLVGAALVRVLMPPLLPGQYRLWIELSQLLWIAAFGGFLLVYLPVLLGASRH